MQTVPQQQNRLQAIDSKSNTPLQLSPASLGQAFRLLDDISARDAAVIARSLGGDPARILEAGYGFNTPAFSTAIGRTIKRNSLILPCRNAKGEIVALHTQRSTWLTEAAPHIANPVRAKFAELVIVDTTSEADSQALSKNVCAIARNGCDDRMVQAAVLSALRSGEPHSFRSINRSEQQQGAIAA